MLDVICVLKTGGCYNLDYVERLKRGVARNLDVPYKFHCLTDDLLVPKEYAIPLQHDWPGWWSKLEIFRDFRGKSLFIDLDTVIVGSLNNLVSSFSTFIALRGFYRDIFNSGLMLWEGNFSHVYETYLNHSDKFEGLRHEQYVIEQCLKSWRIWQDIYPDEVVSYKVHCRGKGLPKDAKVVCFHGKPRPHEVNDSWMKDFWV